MIFGKTHQQRFKEKMIRNTMRAGTWERKFTILPRLMHDGRYVVCGYYHVKYNLKSDNNGDLGTKESVEQPEGIELSTVTTYLCA